jgi:hypothetical protein
MKSFHRRSASLRSDTTLVDEAAEGLLAKGDAPPQWGFWQLMAYKPVQILSWTMFFNS